MNWRWEMLASAIRTHQRAPSEAVRQARTALARAGPKNYTRPCQVTPSKWDGVTSDDTYDSALARVSKAADRCLDCKVYLPCLRLAEAALEERRPTVVGVVAGVLIDNSATGRAVTEALANGADANQQKGSAA